MSWLWRRSLPSEQITDSSSNHASAQVKITQLEKEIIDLKATNELLERKVRFLQVTAVVLLASCAGLCAGFAISMAGVALQAALVSATGVFFAVVTASIAILTYTRR
jgi:hypothetical protein